MLSLRLSFAPHSITKSESFCLMVLMLSIGKLALGQQAYYAKQVAQGRDDYYSGRGEAPGEWVGAGAGELGLDSRVSASEFSALLEGRDPRVPERWLRAQLESAGGRGA